MKIPKFLEDLAIISKLGDNPGADNGLSASDLKAKFDEGVLKLQSYLNTEVVEKINSIFSLDAPPHEGMNMTGPINMNGQSLTGLNEPVEETDAVSKGYVDTENGKLRSDTQEMVRKAAPINLLDNSNFADPIYQAGLNGYHGTLPYAFDRWANNSCITAELGDECVKLSVSGTTSYVFQKVKVTPGKTYTFAARYGTPINGSLWIRESNHGTVYARSTNTTDGNIGIFVAPEGVHEVLFYILPCPKESSGSNTVYWAALYPGKYTLETLPEYQPKGYEAELAECQRYYRQSWVGSVAGKGVTNAETFVRGGSSSTYQWVKHWDKPMRIPPTVTIYSSGNESNLNKIYHPGTGAHIDILGAVYVGAYGFALQFESGKLTTGHDYLFHYVASSDL